MASQTENQVANRIGGQAYYTIVFCLSGGVYYGISFCLFCSALRASWSNDERTPRARNLLLALSCFMFALTTAYFAMVVAFQLTMFSWAQDVITDNTSSLDDRLLRIDLVAAPFALCQPILEIANFIVCDIIVIWRAAVLWQNSRWVRACLGCLLLGDIGVSLYDSVNLSRVPLSTAVDYTSHWVTADAARIIVSMAVNFSATLCIAVKAWKFHRTLRLTFSRATTKKSRVNRVLTLMVECGLLFCAVQLLYAIFTLVIVPDIWEKPRMHPLALFHAAISSFFAFFAGMYPSLFIVIMTKQCSVFGTSSFVACSEPWFASADNDAEAPRSLHLGPIQESRGRHSQVSVHLEDSESEHSPYVAFTTNREKAV